MKSLVAACSGSEKRPDEKITLTLTRGNLYGIEGGHRDGNKSIIRYEISLLSNVLTLSAPFSPWH